MFCIKCGKELPGDAAFCPYCGTARHSSPAFDPKQRPVYSSIESIPPSELMHYAPSVLQDRDWPAVITFEQRMRTSHPSANGLYIPEILLLSLCDHFPLSQGGTHWLFWWFDYGIRDVGAALQYLQARGFIRLATPEEMIPRLALPDLKDALKGIGLPMNGRKAELVERFLHNASSETIAAVAPPPKYHLTELGEAELAENAYVPYMHNHPLATSEDYDGIVFNVWSINRLLGPGPKDGWQHIVADIEQKIATAQKDCGPLRRCTSCNTVYSAAATACPQCGVPAHTLTPTNPPDFHSPRSPSDPLKPAIPSTSSPTDFSSESKSVADPQKKRSGCLSALLAGVVIVCIFILCFFFTETILPMLSDSTDRTGTSASSDYEEYQTSVYYTDQNGLRLAVEIDDYNGSIMKAGTYKVYIDGVDHLTGNEYPALWGIYVTDAYYDYIEEIPEDKIVAYAGGLSLEEGEFTVEAGQYIYCLLESTAGNPVGSLAMFLKD